MPGKHHVLSFVVGLFWGAFLESNATSSLGINLKVEVNGKTVLNKSIPNDSKHIDFEGKDIDVTVLNQNPVGSDLIKPPILGGAGIRSLDPTGVYSGLQEEPCNDDDFPECMRKCTKIAMAFSKEKCKEECCKGGQRTVKKGPEKRLRRAPTCVGKKCGDTCKAGTAGSIYGRCDDRGYCVPPDVHLPCDMHTKQASAQYHESIGYCEGGSSPDGKQIFHDRDCRDRCDALPSCTGYMLPVDTGNNGCATYTSVGASGDGLDRFKCYMKDIGLMDSNDVNAKLLTLVRAGEFKCCLAGSNEPLTCQGICECLEKEMTLPGFTKNAEMVQCKAVDFGQNFCGDTTCSKGSSGRSFNTYTYTYTLKPQNLQAGAQILQGMAIIMANFG